MTVPVPSVFVRDTPRRNKFQSPGLLAGDTGYPVFFLAAEDDRVSDASTRFMPFEARVRDLSERLASCKDERLSLEIALELQTVLHEQIELLRIKAAGVSLFDGDKAKTDTAHVKRRPEVAGSS